MSARVYAVPRYRLPSGATGVIERVVARLRGGDALVSLRLDVPQAHRNDYGMCQAILRVDVRWSRLVRA